MCGDFISIAVMFCFVCHIFEDVMCKNNKTVSFFFFRCTVDDFYFSILPVVFLFFSKTSLVIPAENGADFTMLSLPCVVLICLFHAEVSIVYI